MHAGIFVDNAMNLVPIPEWSEAQTTQYFETAARDALSVGLTSIHDASSTPDQIAFFKRCVNSLGIATINIIQDNCIRHADDGTLPVRFIAL